MRKPCRVTHACHVQRRVCLIVRVLCFVAFSTWSRHPPRQAGQHDVNAPFESVQALRWLIVDEVEAVSAELLAAFETNVRHAVRPEGRTYATRRSDGHSRFMGGINVLFSGDWWQIPPVRQTSLTANPFLKHPPGVARVLQVFWRRDGPDSSTSVHELEEP